jgi:hypothetical protein
MVLGDLGQTRRLAGNPSVSNVSDTDITAALAYGTSMAIGITGKVDWEIDITDPFYNAVVAAVQYFAASEIRDRFMDQTDVSTEHYNRATTILTQITETMSAVGSDVTGGGAGGGSGIATTTYKTFPLNPNAVVYRSLHQQGQELVGTEGYYSSYYNIQ